MSNIVESCSVWVETLLGQVVVFCPKELVMTTSAQGLSSLSRFVINVKTWLSLWVSQVVYIQSYTTETLPSILHLVTVAQIRPFFSPPALTTRGLAFYIWKTLPTFYIGWGDLPPSPPPTAYSAANMEGCHKMTRFSRSGESQLFTFADIRWHFCRVTRRVVFNVCHMNHI